MKNGLEQMEGRVFPVWQARVTKEMIIAFAKAIGDLSPCYVDEEAGRMSRWGDVIAPPTFPVIMRDELLYTSGFWREAGVDLSRVLNGEQRIEALHPIVPGHYTSESRVSRVEAKPGRSGGLVLVTRDTSVSTSSGILVSRVRHVNLVMPEGDGTDG